MTLETIKKLISSFYEGETSREEEVLLFNYFSGTDVAEELLEEKELFLQVYEGEDIVAPAMMESQLVELVDRLARDEQKKKKPKQIMFWAGVAASIAAIVSVSIYLNSPTYRGDYSGIAKNEEFNESYVGIQQFTEAEYTQAENAMLLLASNFSKGVEQLNDMSSKMGEAGDILNEIFNDKK